MRGADLVMKTLADRGVDQIFTLSGNHIMVLFDAALETGQRLIHTRHEAAAVHMADAYGRLTGKPGVAMVTGGPGHANAVPALFTALGADSPVVLISGHAPVSQLGLGAFQELDQVAIAAPVAKASILCASVETLEADVLRALEIASTGRPGPVHLSLPSDILEAEAVAQAGAATAQTQTAAPDFAALASALGAAKRPVIIGGPGFSRAKARAGLAAVAERLGIPFGIQESPRGLNDPSLGAMAEVMPEADLLILANKACDFTVGFAKAPATAADVKVFATSGDEAQLALARQAKGADAITVLATPQETLAALEGIDPAILNVETGWHDKVMSAVGYRPPQWSEAQVAAEGKLHPLDMCAAIKGFLDRFEDPILICDGGEIGQWAQATLDVPRRLTNSVTGSIGASLPFAIGACAADGDAPVVTIMGDGTVGFHLAEFETAVRSNTPFIAIVGNDSVWNAEHQIQIRDYGANRAKGCELLPASYDQVCAALGGYGATVTTGAELAAALVEAHESGRPACINVMLDGRAAPKLRRNAA
jgi:acetolactate synthase-1/2/3 large subunit